MRVLARPLHSSRGRLNNQSGQAVVEYILILVVTIGILLGVMYQFNQAFKKYVQSYFGEYVACLLETGELPSLGGGDGISAEVCSASFEPFSLKDGRPLVETDNSSSGSSSDSGGGGRRSSGSSRSRSGSTLPANKVTRNSRTRNAETGGSSANNSASAENKKSITKRYVSAPSYNFRSDRKRAEGKIPLSSAFKVGLQQKETKSFVASISAKGARGGASVSAPKILVDMDKFKTKPPLVDLNLDLSVGDYIRYIIIFFIIVMIVVFFGGQLFQLKKGYEAS